MSRKLILIRHAETVAPEKTLVGKNDLPLSEAGMEDAIKLKQGIDPGNSEIQYISSELIRARQTAALLFPDIEFEYDKRLNEIDFGNWNGMQIDDIMKNYPDEVNAWSNDPLGFKFPSGESVPEFIARIEDFLHARLGDYRGTTVLVCHSGVIRFILCYMLKLDYHHHLVFQLNKPSLNLVDHDGKIGVLSGLNLTRLVL